MIELPGHESFYAALGFASIPIFALCLPVFLRGLRVARAAWLARLGLGMWLATLVLQVTGWSSAANNLLWATSIGVAHVVMMRCVPLPASVRGWRGLFGWPGAGSWVLAGVVLSREDVDGPLEAFIILALGATILSWGLALNFVIRPRRVLREGELVPAVRFACPRCGVPVDWGKGGTPCPECGLFVHADWVGEDEPPGAADPTLVANPGSLPPGRTAVGLRCPGCGRHASRAFGRSACASCGLWLRVSWNVHGASTGP